MSGAGRLVREIAEAEQMACSFLAYPVSDRECILCQSAAQIQSPACRFRSGFKELGKDKVVLLPRKLRDRLGYDIRHCQVIILLRHKETGCGDLGCAVAVEHQPIKAL